MERHRPWKSDYELEAEMQSRVAYGGGYGRGSVVVAREAPRRPWATYGLLITFVAVFLLELIVVGVRDRAFFNYVFTIYSIPNDYDWIYRPWSPFVSTVSHSYLRVGHILFNGIALYFFGPNLEFRLGRANFLAFFFATGALSGILQAAIVPLPALGASGALMALIGMTIMLEPHARIFLFPFPTPIPLWVAGIIFALVDLAGAMSGISNIGNFAHLGGLAVGLGAGWAYKRRRARPRAAFLVR